MNERNRSGNDERLRVAFVGTATAFSLLGDQALYAVLPVYYNALGISAIEVGILLSANRWIRLLTNDLAHRLTGPEQTTEGIRRLLFVGAFALGACTTFAYGLTKSFWLLLAARLAWGLAWSFIRHLGVQAIMVDGAVERPGRTMGLYNGISRAGSVAITASSASGQCPTPVNYCSTSPNSAGAGHSCRGRGHPASRRTTSTW